jgi:excisionase family DNA binding protein
VNKLLISTGEAADWLGIGKTKLYELIGRGDIPTVRIGRAVRIPAAAIEDWVRRQLNGAHDQDAG